MTQTATNQTLPNRWLLAGGCFLMQLALGRSTPGASFEIH